MHALPVHLPVKTPPETRLHLVALRRGLAVTPMPAALLILAQHGQLVRGVLHVLHVPPHVVVSVVLLVGGR